MRAWFHDYFCPAHAVTLSMVDDLATDRWRLADSSETKTASIREQMVRTRPQNEKLHTQLSTDVEVVLAMKALADESRIPERMDRAEGRLFDQLMKHKRNPPSDDTLPETYPSLTNWQTETPIAARGHPQG